MPAGQSRNEPLVANARMYSTGAAQAGKAWTSLLNWVVAHADAPLEVLDYPPPKPLDALWARGDLGCTFMCGLPYSRDPRPLTPIIAPVVRGARYAGRPIYFTDTENFYRISQDSLIGYVLPSLPIPNAVLILFFLAVVSSITLNRTALGRYTFALGSNEEAVRLSGVNVDRWKIAIYGLAGAICGVAGLLIASRLNSAQPALGQGYELEAIAAVVIGGTSLSGGAGTILGTIIGAFIMSVLTNGLRIMSVAQEWQTVVTGVIIILAVYTDILRRGRQ